MPLTVGLVLIPLGSKITQFHNRILCTWVHGLVTGVQNHNTDEKRPVADVNDAPVSYLCQRQRVSGLSFVQVVSCQNLQRPED